MKTLYESLSDIENEANIQWVEKNYFIYLAHGNGEKVFTITNGVLNAPNLSFQAKPDLKELTNGKFKFGEVYEFVCSDCPYLKNLNGGPTKVLGSFSCEYCENLRDLEGSPRYVGEDFNCSACEKLSSLKGAPDHVGVGFISERCKNLKSLQGLPEHIGKCLSYRWTPATNDSSNEKYIKSRKIAISPEPTKSI